MTMRFEATNGVPRLANQGGSTPTGYRVASGPGLLGRVHG